MQQTSFHIQSLAHLRTINTWLPCTVFNVYVNPFTFGHLDISNKELFDQTVFYSVLQCKNNFSNVTFSITCNGQILCLYLDAYMGFSILIE